MTTSKYDNQNLDKEELAMDKLFTSEKAFFISKEELEKEKARYSSYKVKSESKKNSKSKTSIFRYCKNKSKSGVNLNSIPDTNDP